MTEKDQESPDLMIVLKAAQDLSREIEPGKLYEKLMKVVVENTGAQRGIFILKKKRQLQVVALFDIENHSKNDFQPLPLEISDAVPHDVINYVKRSGKTFSTG